VKWILFSLCHIVYTSTHWRSICVEKCLLKRQRPHCSHHHPSLCFSESLHDIDQPYEKDCLQKEDESQDSNLSERRTELGGAALANGTQMLAGAMGAGYGGAGGEVEEWSGYFPHQVPWSHLLGHCLAVLSCLFFLC
jgi:hypothetical protein